MKTTVMCHFAPNLILQARRRALSEARDNLREALELFFETAPSEEILSRFHEEVYVTQVRVAVG